MSDVLQLGSEVQAHATIELAAGSKLEYGEVEFIISKTVVDRYDETIHVKGIDYSAYLENPIVLWAHDYSALPLGKAIKIWRKGDELRGIAKFATDILPFADTVYKLIMAGVLNAVSIGGRVKEWGVKNGSDDYSQIARLDMYEFSVVNVPANPAALVASKSVEGLSEDSISKTYNDFVKRAKAPDLHDTLESYVTLIKDLHSGLETVIKNASSLSAGEPPKDPKDTASEARSVAKVLKIETEAVIKDLNAKLKGLHNDRQRNNQD